VGGGVLKIDMFEKLRPLTEANLGLAVALEGEGLVDGGETVSDGLRASTLGGFTTDGKAFLGVWHEVRLEAVGKTVSDGLRVEEEKVISS